MTLTKEQREKTKKLVEDLSHAFVWSETKQGGDYWSKIKYELSELTKEDIRIEEKWKN